MIVIRRAGLLALTMTFALLSGCGGGAKEKTAFEAWRQSYAAAESHEIEAVVKASDDTRAVEYKLRYHAGTDGETVEVLAPETVASVKARVADDGARLEYDGVQLDTGTALAGRLTPLLSLPTLSRLLKTGHVESVWTEKRDGERCSAAELGDGSGVRLRLWQNDGGAPVFAELRSGDRVEISVNITKFS